MGKAYRKPPRLATSAASEVAKRVVAQRTVQHRVQIRDDEGGHGASTFRTQDCFEARRRSRKAAAARGGQLLLIRAERPDGLIRAAGVFLLR